MTPERKCEPQRRIDTRERSLEIRGLTLSLGGHAILHSIDLALPATGISVLIGPSGAGKSTLLRCANGLQTSWHGAVRIFGSDAHEFPGGPTALRRTVGLIAQKPVVFPCSIRQNVLFGLRSRAQRKRGLTRLDATLRQVGLWNEVCGRLDEPAEALSLGQQQRLCIARALMLEPRLLMLDEPTASLDSRSRQTLEQTLRALATSIPLLCVTHDLEQAQRLADRVIFLCEGHLIEQGTAQDFFNRPTRLETREFLSWSVCDCD